ncbi:MAG TPA: hypothetical protein VGS22_03545 [Thermoanaerobaculia bacterium]|jgi:ELWxxDGT repeat protein|nr:hypothetical protein [Thermoanaerobaculia bacterium]
MTCRRRSLLAAVLGSFALAALIGGAPARALTPYRVADLNPTFHSAGSRPERFVQVGSRSLFTARTPGFGLWSSNGTAAGTVRLLRNQRSIEILTATGELVFFFACDAQRCRLYATDGTVAGTHAIAGPYSTATPTAVAGPRRIFFTHSTPATGRELWTSDGTPAGTRMVKDLAPGPASSFSHRLVWFRDRLWFFALDGLWTSDGRASGTRRIATVGTGIQAGPAGTRLLFFAAAPGASEARLWSSDGTAAGTRVLPGVAPLESSQIQPFAATGTDAFFFVSRFESPARDEVWASDGTPSRTRRLAQFRFDAVRPEFVVVGSRVGFIASDDEHGPELWTSDGKPAGTRALDICPGECSGAFDVGASDGSRVWFSGDGDTNGSELWTSDLTPAGTHLVKDIAPGFSSSSPEAFLVGGGKAFFTTRIFGQESLWVSDGTAAGTRELARPPDEDTSLQLGLGTIANGRFFFSRTDEEHGSEPWVSDGTVAGTALISDLEPSQDGGSFPYALRAGAGRCFFFANADFNSDETELWSSNGTVAGTVLANRFDNERFAPSNGTIRAADLGSRIALLDVQFSDQAEIWISDGTAGGTFRADSNDQQPTGRFRAIGGRLYFEASDAEHGLELWTTDGTPAGTVRLSDFENPDPFPELFDSERGPFRELGGRLAFLAADAFGRFEPWVSDGSIGGTRHLADVYPALVAPFFELSSEIVQIGGKYFFVSGEESEVGTEPALWVTDLTAAGTHKVAPLGGSTGNPVSEIGLFALGGRLLLFYVSDSERGFRSSDGTDFELVRTDIGIAFGSTGSRNPVLWNGRLVFLGDDGRIYTTDGTAEGTTFLVKPDGQPVLAATGFAGLAGRLAYTNFEGVWDTNGTAAGTVRRVAPREGLAITEFVRVGDRIFFPWYDVAAGTELWALRP